MQESQPSSSQTTSIGRSRGKLILALAISSLFFIPAEITVNYYLPFHDVLPLVVLITFLIAPILGISAWVMANRDLRKIREGTLPATAHGVTKTGKILGIFSTFIVPPFILLIAVLYSIFTAQSRSISKDAIINDLNNLCAHAYQYRIHPESMGGGQGSYHGYEIPAKMSQNENGRYTAYILHADTVKFIAKAIEDSSKTIEVKIDSEGGLIASSWIYGGDFK